VCPSVITSNRQQSDEQAPIVQTLLTATNGPHRLHGPDALKMMRRYRIGRITGYWTNFVPPIQGGKFKLLTSGSPSPATNYDGGGATSSSTACPPSPRHPCHETARQDGNIPLFDESSSEACYSDDRTPDGMSYIDIQTRKEIRLDLAKYPAVDVQTQHMIVEKFRALHKYVKRQGLYRCNYWAYAVEMVRISLLFGGFIFFLRKAQHIISGFCLAFFWQQLAFIAHDAGHLAITHNMHIDTLIGIFVADFLGGLSITWWKRNHNVHHIITNAPEHDPDIEHMPFFAISHRLLSNLRSTYYDRAMKYDAVARFFIPLQAWLYYPIMGVARFNLYAMSWDHLIAQRGPRKGAVWWHWWAEMVGQIFFWWWFGYGVLYCTIPTNMDRFVFILVCHAVSAILHIQITLSHFAMSTADLGPQESFPQRMLRTTMDVDCPQWLDFFHGGLQFQVTHHLFPRMPRHNLREASKLVQEFCAEVGIPYVTYGFASGNGQVVGRLANISRQAAMLAKCQRSLAKNSKIH